MLPFGEGSFRRRTQRHPRLHRRRSRFQRLPRRRPHLDLRRKWTGAGSLSGFESVCGMMVSCSCAVALDPNKVLDLIAVMKKYNG